MGQNITDNEKNIKARETVFYTDRPLISKEEDLLNRKGFARLLANTLIKLSSNETFTVGLYGGWGHGKTSLVNMTLDEVNSIQESEENKLIIIRFDPWIFFDSEQLVSQFFVRLSSEFKSKDDERISKIGELLVDYSEAFEFAKAIPSIGGVIAFIGKRATRRLGNRIKDRGNNNDIHKQKENIINHLKKLSNKILIVIDDIDRLNNQQIRQVFQLVTSVAKFPNIIYLLAFDRQIVVNALEEVQGGNGEEYLEKVIQMPIEVPSIQRNRLNDIFFNRLDDIIQSQEDIIFEKDYWQQTYFTCIAPFIKNIRDINRICNIVQFKLTALKSEVNFVDIIIISIVEVFLPELFNWIKVNKVSLTGEMDMSAVEFNRRSTEEWHKTYLDEINYLISKKDSGLSEKSLGEKAIEILSYIFPYFGNKIGKNVFNCDKDKLRLNNRIGHVDKFDRYFDLSLDDITLKKVEILHYIQGGTKDELGEYIIEKDKEGSAYELIEELKAMISELPIDRVCYILDTLLEYSNQLESSRNNSIFNMSAYFSARFLMLDLIEKLEAKERMPYLIRKLNEADLAKLRVFADVINMIELGYGRLAANGVERNYKKVITIDELLELEKRYSDRLKVVLKGESLFSVKEWSLVLYLLECFDPKYTANYLSEELREEKNVANFVARYVSAWSGDGVSYEIKSDYKKYLEDERVLAAIMKIRDNGELFKMEEEVQNRIAAFFLNNMKERDFEDDIPQSKVEALLKEWKNVLDNK